MLPSIEILSLWEVIVNMLNEDMLRTMTSSLIHSSSHSLNTYIPISSRVVNMVLGTGVLW